MGRISLSMQRLFRKTPIPYFQPFAPSFLFILIFYASCNSFNAPETADNQHKYKVFDTGTLSVKSEEVFLNTITQICHNDKYFNHLVISMEKAGLKISIIEDSKKLQFPAYVPLTVNKGNIYFKSVVGMTKPVYLYEELFHAFQLYYYQHYHKIDFINHHAGGVNIEYEAKFFRNMAFCLSGCPIAETPSQKGLIGFIMQLSGDSLFLHNFSFSSHQNLRYTQLVKSFENHWLHRDSVEKTTSLYSSRSIDTLQPCAALWVLKTAQ